MSIIKPLHVLTRFAVSGVLQLVLLNFSHALALSGGINREVHLAFEEGILAAIAVVVIFPILMRGDFVQRILSVVFIIFPLIELVDALQRALYLKNLHPFSMHAYAL